MKARRLSRSAASALACVPAFVLALAAAFILGACNDDVAGSSSGVDNPEIALAFTSSSSAALTTTGSLSIYQSNQNPALDPNPIVQVRLVNDSSISLSETDFIPAGDSTGDSTQSYNVLFIGDDSTGGLLQSITFNPKTGKFSLGDTGVTRVSMKLSPLVNYASTLQGASDSNPERVFIPGTPFQCVVVDSGFAFTQIPSGTFPVHLITGSGVELPLPDSLNTLSPKPIPVNSGATPIPRPPAPPPPPLQVNAGTDQTVYLGTQIFLYGQVTGVSGGDPQLAILWRQISPNPDSISAVIANPTALNTSVSFPKPGAYRFVLSATFGTSPPKQDTVWIGVQPTPPTTFIAPYPGDTVLLGKPFQVFWSNQTRDTLSLQFSVNNGPWATLPKDSAIVADSGFDTLSWTPTGAASFNCQLRLVNSSDTLMTVQSGRFTLAP